MSNNTERAIDTRTTMTLSRALQLKNRLAAQLTTKQNAAARHSYYKVSDGVAQSTSKHTSDHYQDALMLQGQLIELKTKIQEANAPIVPLLIELEELKSEMSRYLNTLNDMSTESGSILVGTNVVKYNTVLVVDHDIVAARYNYVNKRMDNIQDSLNAHNFSTKITVSFTI